MYTVKEFNSRDAFQDYLNGAALGKPLDKLVFGLDGKTFAVTPSGGSKVTVTFSDPTFTGLTPAAIIKAIVTASTNALAGVVGLRNYGYTNSQNPQIIVDQVGAVIDKTGTANSILGFATAADTTITEVTTSSIESVTVNPSGPLYVLVLHS